MDSENSYPKPASPDYQSWKRKDLWRIGEAVALLFGYEPEKGDSGLWECSPDDVDRCAEVVSLLDRGIRSGTLDVVWDDNDEVGIDFSVALVRPAVLVTWLLGRGITVPESLRDLKGRLGDKLSIGNDDEEVSEESPQTSESKAHQQGESSRANHEPAAETQSRVSANPIDQCLPYRPEEKRKQDWYRAIEQVVLDLYDRDGRCPDKAQVWARLWGCQPSGFDITRHPRLKLTIWMREDKRSQLDQAAFYRRWKRWTMGNARSRATRDNHQ